MNVETMLTEELREVGAALRTPPPPDAAGLVRTARRDRTHRRARTVGAIALAAAVIAGVVAIGAQVSKPSAGPDPAPQPTELPTGAPPRIPYVKDSKLYLDGVLRPGSWVSINYAGQSAIGTLDVSDSTVNTIVLFRNGIEKDQIATAAYQQPTLLSPDGTKAVWVERDSGAWYLVERDMTSNSELGRLRVSAAKLAHVGAESEAWETLREVSDDGTVSYAGVLAAHSWKPGRGVVDLDPDAYQEDDPTGYPPEAGYVWVNPAGTWGAWTIDHTGEQSQAGTETPAQHDVEVLAQKPGQPKTRIEFALPPGTNASGADWEDDKSFLVTVFDEPDGSAWHYVRCTITTRACVVAPTPTTSG